MAKRKLSVTASGKGRYLKVFINRLPHLAIELQEVVGFNSWINSANWFCIEITLKTTTLRLEYDKRELWEQVLSRLNEHIV